MVDDRTKNPYHHPAKEPPLGNEGVAKAMATNGGYEAMNEKPGHATPSVNTSSSSAVTKGGKAGSKC